MEETLAINLTMLQLVLGRPRKTVPLIYRSKREEIWGHRSPNPSNWSSTCRGSVAAQGEEIQIIYSSDVPLAATGQPLVSSHRRAGQGNKKVLSDIWLESDSPCRHSINIITSLILNKYYSFLKSLPRPRFCEGTGEGAAKWNKIIEARIERRKTQFMKPAWQPIKHISASCSWGDQGACGEAENGA